MTPTPKELAALLRRVAALAEVLLPGMSVRQDREFRAFWADTITAADALESQDDAAVVERPQWHVEAFERLERVAKHDGERVVVAMDFVRREFDNRDAWAGMGNWRSRMAAGVLGGDK